MYYEDYLQTVDHNECTVVMDKILMYGERNFINFYLTPAVYIQLPNHNIKVIINNSCFQSMIQEVLYIDTESGLYSYHNTIQINNYLWIRCTW